MSESYSDVTCVECGVSIGSNKSVYKHTLGCLNLQPRGITALLKEHEGSHNEHSVRVVKMLQFAKGRGE